jgi:hypothetical protein
VAENAKWYLEIKEKMFSLKINKPYNLKMTVDYCSTGTVLP